MTEQINKRMGNKEKYPFSVSCRKCGSNRVVIRAYDYCSLEIYCKNCGFFLDCGHYDTESGRYSE